MANVRGVVLAAGAGRRMGGPKAELSVGGRRLVDIAVAALTGGGCDSVLAVVRDGVTVGGTDLVVNPRPERGMRSSVETALTATAGADALAVMLVDTPGIGAAAVRAVTEHWRATRRVSVAVFTGRRGHPTVMSVDQWRAAIALAAPDEGARAYLRRFPELVDEVAVDGDPTDLDYPADLP